MRLQITRNFRRNLDEIREFLSEAGEEPFFEQLLDELFLQVFPDLAQFPQVGVDFFRRKADSLEVARRVEALRRRLGQDLQLRELIHGNYLLLYAVGTADLYLLSIRHHRQLSFDLPGHWPKTR